MENDNNAQNNKEPKKLNFFKKLVNKPGKSSQRVDLVEPGQSTARESSGKGFLSRFCKRAVLNKSTASLPVDPGAAGSGEVATGLPLAGGQGGGAADAALINQSTVSLPVTPTQDNTIGILAATNQEDNHGRAGLDAFQVSPSTPAAGDQGKQAGPQAATVQVSSVGQSGGQDNQPVFQTVTQSAAAIQSQDARGRRELDAPRTLVPATGTEGQGFKQPGPQAATQLPSVRAGQDIQPGLQPVPQSAEAIQSHGRADGSRAAVVTMAPKDLPMISPDDDASLQTPSTVTAQDDNPGRGPQGLYSPLGTQGQVIQPAPHTVTERTSATQERVGGLNDLNQDSGPSASATRSNIKDNLKLTGRALTTLVTKAADVVDSNPAKVALGLVKAVVNVAKTVHQNNDTIARQIVSTGEQLETLVTALDNWKPEYRRKEDMHWLNYFKLVLEKELHGLEALKNESKFKKFLDHEHEQSEIADIFVRINEARIRFEIALDMRVFTMVHDINQAIKDLWLDRLNPSQIAHHAYLLEGQDAQLLYRQMCTPGTRENILGAIISWAKDTSSTCPSVYWLFGHAGSGKSTIAFTIARRFAFNSISGDNIILGGDFLCSRHFDETRLSKFIIRTIVYQLALRCPPFLDALERSTGGKSVITYALHTQLDLLLFGPWHDCQTARLMNKSLPKYYLIVIDALDEVEGTGGSEFLRVLVNIINNDTQNRTSGLKFFITSRSDDKLVKHVDSLIHKDYYRLQDVSEEEASQDVHTYLYATPNATTYVHISS